MGPGAPVPAAAMRRLLGRMLANWTVDLLSTPDPLVWRGPDPQCDPRDRDWRQLYKGSVLDD